MSTNDPNRVRDALVRAARDLLAEGEANPTIPQMTARAGVGIGSFYKYFGTKEALIEAAARDAATEHIRWLHQVTGDSDDLIESIAVRFRLNAMMPQTHPAIAAMYLNPRTTQLMSDVRTEHVAKMPAERLRAAGLTPDDFDAAMTAGNGTTLMLILQGAREGAVPAEHVERVLLFILAALGVPRERGIELARRPLPPLPG